MSLRTASLVGMRVGFLVGFYLGLGAIGVLSVLAHSSPTNAYDNFRLPWSEGTGENRSVGCPPGGGGDPDCTAHVGNDAWAIDFSSMNNREPVKAIGGGTLTYIDQGNQNFGRQAIIEHAGGWVSIYGHLCSWLTLADQTAHQGDWLGGAGNTGGVQPPVAEPCSGANPLPSAHLHFIVRLGGVSQNATPKLCPSTLCPLLFPIPGLKPVGE